MHELLQYQIKWTRPSGLVILVSTNQYDMYQKRLPYSRHSVVLFCGSWTRCPTDFACASCCICFVKWQKMQKCVGIGLAYV
jgi:hypothetical protein